MQQESEYAPQYSTRERRRRALIGIACIAVFWVIWTYWGLPRLQLFTQTAHCRTVFGLPGFTVLMHGLFVGLPLVIAASLGWVVMPHAVKCIRSRRYPAPGRKVTRKTKIQTGRRAVLSAVMEIAMIGSFVIISVWGGFQASELSRLPRNAKQIQQCAGNLAAGSGAGLHIQ